MATAIVVGTGVFGVTAALALRARGWDVDLLDQVRGSEGPLPHPLAESTDISKIVRLDYGADELYTALMERALEGWRAWNRAWPAPLFHETGVLFLAEDPLAPGGFEHDSAALLEARGHRIERLDAGAIAARFPAFTGSLRHGYFNPQGGFAESGRVVERLAREAADRGVRLRSGAPVSGLSLRGERVTGVRLGADELSAELVVVAAGSWTGHLVPWLAPHLRSTGHPVILFDPEGSEARAFEAARFPVFAADISRTGFYGFPRHEGVVKVANHGVGRLMHPESSERVVRAEDEAAFRAFLGRAIPSLAGAPIARTRVCVYGDTWDQHLWIAPDPDHPGLVIAAGGSGHGFKFAPVLGELVARAAEGDVEPRFRHRPEIAANAKGEERARHQG